MNIEKEKICVCCKEPFKTTNENQDTCNPCLIKPHRPIQPMEVPVAIVTVDSKVCVGCKEPFKPTSNVQKYCPKCRSDGVVKRKQDERCREGRRQKSGKSGPRVKNEIPEPKPESKDSFVARGKALLDFAGVGSVTVEGEGVRIMVESLKTVAE